MWLFSNNFSKCTIWQVSPTAKKSHGSPHHHLSLFSFLPLFSPSLNQQTHNHQHRISPIDLVELTTLSPNFLLLTRPLLLHLDFSSVADPCSSFAGVTYSFSRVTILTLGAGPAGTLSPAIVKLTKALVGGGNPISEQLVLLR